MNSKMAYWAALTLFDLVPRFSLPPASGKGNKRDPGNKIFGQWTFENNHVTLLDPDYLPCHTKVQNGEVASACATGAYLAEREVGDIEREARHACRCLLLRARLNKRQLYSLKWT